MFSKGDTLGSFPSRQWRLALLPLNGSISGTINLLKRL